MCTIRIETGQGSAGNVAIGLVRKSVKNWDVILNPGIKTKIELGSILWECNPKKKPESMK